MITGPSKWYAVAETLRMAVHNNLTVIPDRSGVVPGAIAWDECDCGLLAVSVNQIFPSEVFPELLTNPSGACDASIEVGEFVIQLIRCAPQPEGQGVSPSVAALNESAVAILLDAYEMIQGARGQLCAMESNGDIYDFILRPLTAQGPSGVCVGNELRILVGLLRG